MVSLASLCYSTNVYDCMMIHNFASGHKYSEALVYGQIAKFLTQFGINHLWSVSLEFIKTKEKLGPLGAKHEKKYCLYLSGLAWDLYGPIFVVFNG